MSLITYSAGSTLTFHALETFILKGFKKIEGFLQSMKPAQLELISQHIPEAEALARTAGPAEEGFAMGGAGGSVNVPTGKVKPYKARGKKPAGCQYCGIKKKEFSKNEETLDLHYVEDCVMLT